MSDPVAAAADKVHSQAVTFDINLHRQIPMPKASLLKSAGKTEKIAAGPGAAP